MFDRDRRKANRAFDQGDGVTRYRMRQKLVAIGDDYWIDDDSGEHVYRVDGKVLRARKTFDLEDPHGHRVATVQSRPMRIKESMAIDDAEGHRVAVVKKAVITPLRNRWSIDQEDGPELSVEGNVVDHEYTIERDGYKIAEVSKKWFRIRDTYGVSIGEGADHTVVLAATVAIDSMAHPGD
ncbi:LURP-one-related/scramblase family protein [Kitasatospora sp. A2-31]|uniref:LURP-one-related/scramblase family protein n=1 Tax=Kitasatospora sp. A2-31 TaxID=2916414 RepID=UPI001EED9471|nr:LURP-one-related family protein [Kitasatospora sp. A2-31]MCG6499961.1 LURP-one-related family protein [Kitasatospora sp. A2-31]